MSSLWVGALVMGLAGSGHCGAMCGGIASSSVAKSRGRRTLLGASLHVGRLVTYATFGALVGGLGTLLNEVSVLHRLFAPLRGALGVLLVGLGLTLALGTRSLSRLDALGTPLWRRVLPYARRLSGPSTPLRALAFGTLWGLLPCGMVYAALAVATASGSPVGGAGVMLAFGAGTLPALVLISSLASRVRQFLARPSVRVAFGFAVVVSGVVNLTAAWSSTWGAAHFAPTTDACCHPIP